MSFSLIQGIYKSVIPVANAKTARPSLIRREDGFTLNEILISIALIAIGIIGFSVNTIGVIQGNYISGNVTVATSLAQDKLEELKTGTIANVDNCPTTTHTPTVPAGHDHKITAVGASGGAYDRCWVIKDRATLGTSIKEIDVTVSWTDYISRSITLSTLVYTG